MVINEVEEKAQGVGDRLVFRRGIPTKERSQMNLRSPTETYGCNDVQMEAVRHDIMQESHSPASTTGRRAVIPPCPRRNQTTSTSDDRELPPNSCKVNEQNVFGLPLLSFAWSASSSSPPTLGKCLFSSVPTASSPP
ncbi:hypothetical protein LQV05_001016 [Cryptococcus neoformans]|nr:hypothetical protein LQV05_001016 [Cryptococcus neoformans]